MVDKIDDSLHIIMLYFIDITVFSHLSSRYIVVSVTVKNKLIVSHFVIIVFGCV